MCAGVSEINEQQVKTHKSGGFSRAIGSIISTAAIGTLASAGFGFFKPMAEDTFMTQYTINGLKGDYTEKLKELEAQKNTLTEELKGITEEADKNTKTKELAGIEKRYELFKKEGANKYAKKIIERIKPEAPASGAGQYAGAETFRSRLNDLAQKGKELFETEGKQASTKEEFAKIVKGVKIANVKKFARLGAIYSAIGGFAFVVLGALSGSSKNNGR